MPLVESLKNNTGFQTVSKARDMRINLSTAGIALLINSTGHSHLVLLMECGLCM